MSFGTWAQFVAVDGPKEVANEGQMRYSGVAFDSLDQKLIAEVLKADTREQLHHVRRDKDMRKRKRKMRHKDKEV